MHPARLPSAVGAALAALALSLCAAGCRGKAKDFENENDTLRRQVAELEQQLTASRARNVEIEAKFAELKRANDAAMGGDALEALPRCAGIAFDRYTGWADTDRDRTPDGVDVYIKPFDGRQRFVQVAGRLTVEATLLPGSAGGEAGQPRLLARTTLGPSELREAYRSSPLGTHYSVRLGGLDARGAESGTLVIRAELEDSISGLVHRAERVVSPQPR